MQPDSAPGLQPGDPREIGGCRILRRLGMGGMGVVYLAADPTGRRVAVKVIHPHWARDPDFRRRFTREVAAARRVARFCTAPVLDASVDGETAYLTTEYVDGPDLSQVVRDHGPLSGGNLEALAVGIAVALNAIHHAGVVHRDLKPSNVLLSPTGPRVIDFGISQLTGPESVPSQHLLGTPTFMAPEQVRGEPTTPASDVFSWGGVITYAGTGRLPFGGGSTAEVLHRVVNEGPNLDGLDQRIRGLVERALAKRPEERPAPQELLDELAGVPTIEPEAATEIVEQTWTGELTSELTPQLAPTLTAVTVDPPSGSPTGERGGSERAGNDRRRRRTMAVVLAGVVAAAVLAVVGSQLVGAGDTAQLPYETRFADAAGGWDAGTTQGGRASYQDGAFELTANPGWLLWRSAPLPGLRDVVISTNTVVTAGTGGVWCRGDPDRAGTRYRFVVSEDGRGAILKDRPGGDPVVLLAPTAPTDEPADGSRRVVARCRDADGGVELQLWVDETMVGRAVDRDGYGPGEVGVFATAEGASAPVAVRFDDFRVEGSEAAGK